MSETQPDLREALAYLTPHPATKGPVILDPVKMRSAVSALQAEVERLQKGIDLAADEATSHRNSAVAALRERDAALERLQKVEGEREKDAERVPSGPGYSGSAPSPQAVSASGEYPSRGALLGLINWIDRNLEQARPANNRQWVSMRFSVREWKAIAAVLLRSAPCDEHPQGEDAIAAEGRSPASTVTGAARQAPWPSGCIKPGSCSRHATCMYAQTPEKCRHFGKDLTAEIAETSHAR